MTKHFITIVGTGMLAAAVSCTSSQSKQAADEHSGEPQAEQEMTTKEENDGWEVLFDGKTTGGWHTYLQEKAGAGWKVEEGALAFDPSAENGGGDLVTDREFEDYELSLEWKISAGGNSGIIFNVHEDPKYTATYLTGPEMQVLDNKEAADNKLDNHLAGALYDMIDVGREVARPAGEWNEARIRMQDRHLTLWLNGTKTAEVTIGSDEWNELIAQSKFHDWKEFGTYEKGRIALQDHGNKVWYRNIKIKEL